MEINYKKQGVRTVVLFFALALAFPFVGITVHAQQDSVLVEAKNVDIRSQPLGNALVELSDMFGVSILTEDVTVRGRQATEFRGTYDVAEALDRLLRGTGLRARLSDTGVFIVERADTSNQDMRVAPRKTDVPEVVEELIVYGTKQKLSLQDTQVSVALFTEDMIEEQILFDVEDILMRAPNVSTDGSGALNSLSIRGVPFVGVGNAGTGNTSTVYVDNAPNSRAANNGAANLWDVAQVEILRGPQSTIQGRNALAGALVVRTAEPEYEFGGKVRVMVGNEDHRQYSGSFTGPIVTDQLAFRLAADYREADFAVVDIPTGRPARFQEALTLRGKLLLEPDALPGLSIKAIGNYVDTEFGEFNLSTAPVPATDPTFLDFDRFGNETFGGSGRNITTEAKQGIIDIGYELNERWSLVFIGTIEDSFRNTNLPNGDLRTDFKLYTGEVRTVFDYGWFRGWVGGYYYDEEEDGTFNLSIPSPFPTSPPNGVILLDSDSAVDTENYALFADVTFKVGEHWLINLGLRQDWEEFSDSGLTIGTTSDPANCIFDPSIPGLGGLPCAAILPASTEPPKKADFSSFLPRGSITYKFDEWRSISFGIQRGYRAGGSFVFGLPGDELETLEFDAEFITNYEVAFRSQWLEERLTVNANVYFADWTDQQVAIDEQTPSFFDIRIINAGESEIYGAEVNVVGLVNEFLEVFASFGIAKTEFTDFPFAAASTDPQFVNLSGNRFDTAPEFTGAAGFTFSHPSGFFTSWNVAYTDEQFSDITNLPQNETDSYVLVNARVGYSSDQFEVFLFANNLLDERVATRRNLFSANNNTGVVTPNERGEFVVNDPPLFGFTLTARL